MKDNSIAYTSGVLIKCRTLVATPKAIPQSFKQHQTLSSRINIIATAKYKIFYPLKLH